MFYTTDPKDRAAFIASLRQLADFLALNPAAPVPLYGTEITLSADAYEDGGKAQVERIARLMSASIDDEVALGGHYRATREFGSLGYTVASIPYASTARYEAEKTYWGCITPDTPGAS